MTTISEETERIEREILQPHAQLAAESHGRERPEDRDPLRTCYQRDRDRIVHSKAFRRLKHKTQVFFNPETDHFRVRLTHTLETAQIARTIARALRLNEDLTEAIALAHDLGHTPFGHVGETVLTRLLGRPFKHAEQSLRIVDVLERLNLTREVRDGILGHTWSQPEPPTLEGRVVRYADRVAYLNHDLDDAVRAGVIEWTDVPAETKNVLGETNPARINSMVMAIVEASQEKPDIEMRPDALDAMLNLREFLFDRVYMAELTQSGRVNAERVIEDLYRHYLAHPDRMPAEYHRAPNNGDSLEIRVADFVSGMTDRYAIGKHKEIA